VALLGTVIGRGVVGSRPAAGTAGAMYYGTDTLRWYRDNGSSWDDASGNPMTTAGDIIYGGASGLETRLATGTAGYFLIAGAAPSYVAGDRVLFVSTADRTITNDNNERTLIGTGVGTLTLPAALLIVGRTIRLRAHGYYTSNANLNQTWRVTLGATAVCNSGAVDIGNNGGPYIWEAETIITCRTTGVSGTVIGQMKIWLASSDTANSGTASSAMFFIATPVSSTTVLDTTGALALDFTLEPASLEPNVSVTTTNVTCEILN
jgi:hypothetical protein